MIPFNAPGVIGRELDYLADAARSLHLAGDGPFTKRCEAMLAQHLGAARVLLTTSCTHALEMSALLVNAGAGDEVILPSFTFVSTANAFVLRGATPIFADIRTDTLNIDERHVESLLSPRTRAIVVVHYAGIACNMEALGRLAEARDIPIIEDNAHGLFGRYRGRPLGSLGAMATLSFHDTKNFTCGEGGATVINDGRFVEQAEIIREKGTNRSRFFRGQVDKYTWMGLGSSYVPSDMLAAFLYGQLEQHERVQSRRKAIFTKYAAALDAWAEQHGVKLPTVPPDCDPAWHLFYLCLPDLETRQRFIAHMKAREIHALFHYLPLHVAPMGQQWGGRPGSCPVTEQMSDRLVRLPFFTTMSEDQQDRVIAATLAFAG
jgi:dTDP-4-amino-4,6-dideoxygalactose transaminase